MALIRVHVLNSAGVCYFVVVVVEPTAAVFYKLSVCLNRLSAISLRANGYHFCEECEGKWPCLPSWTVHR